jgi:polysaccharide biosynthesis protein PslG
MTLVREAGFGWVRVQLQWRELEPSPGAYNAAPYDTIIGAAREGGAQVLVSVVKSPDWAAPSRPGGLPEDVDAFARTMRFLAERYRGKVGAWEVWNEQNLAGEVGGRVEVGPYVETLRAAYGAVKAADPAAFVLFGGLTPTGTDDPAVAIDDVEYLRRFYAHDGGAGRAAFDALAAHAGSAANPPDARLPDRPGSGTCPPQFADREGTCWRDGPEFYFRRVAELRAIMEAHGDGPKQVWLTEFGWDACQGLPAPAGYEYCALTSEEQQAEYLTRAFAIAREEWPWVGAMFVWNLNYAATPNIRPDDEKFAWSLLRADWSPRPAYTALKEMAK